MTTHEIIEQAVESVARLQHPDADGPDERRRFRRLLRALEDKARREGYSEGLSTRMNPTAETRAAARTEPDEINDDTVLPIRITMAALTGLVRSGTPRGRTRQLILGQPNDEGFYTPAIVEHWTTNDALDEIPQTSWLGYFLLVGFFLGGFVLGAVVL